MTFTEQQMQGFIEAAKEHNADIVIALKNEPMYFVSNNEVMYIEYEHDSRGFVSYAIEWW